MSTTALEVNNLKTYFKTGEGLARAVDDLSFKIEQGSTFALVGESGCGKSVTALSIIQLLGASGVETQGEILLNGNSISSLPETEKRRIRGNRISMIFQEPMTSLNPVFTIGNQIIEALTLHQGLSKAQAKEAAISMLREVKFTDPEAVFNDYPHRLSGGMRQRVMIAMALCCKPDLLIADEPTTALDVTIQKDIMALMSELKTGMGTAVLLITHNLALVYNNADTVGVMYAGRLVELAPARVLFANPKHPYTIKLMRSIPGAGRRGQPLDTIRGTVPPATEYPEGCRFSGRCPREMEGCAATEPELTQNKFDGEEEKGEHLVACHLYNGAFMNTPASRPLGVEEKTEAAPHLESPAPAGEEAIVEISGLKTWYPIRKGIFKKVQGYVRAVDGIDLTVRSGQTLALVGESGCGKTSAGKTILRLIKPAGGCVSFRGEEITSMGKKDLKGIRSKMQIIFQDPYSSLNPRLMVSDIIEEGIRSLLPELSKSERIDRVAEVLDLVGLGGAAMTRYPHEFSGGQRQRIGIARALAVRPEFIICDEAVSALDVSVQAQILNLLKTIQQEFGISYLFITHDLGVVEYIADEVAVMYDGKIVERGLVDDIFSRPAHEYTKKLLSAVPVLPG
ncbi:MAG: dipeptide ABC transporter ATP-binding protein [Thermodesulfobacteriota bacterium]